MTINYDEKIMKSFTDIEQGKKLAEILPTESADMCWAQIYDENHLMSDYKVELLPFRFCGVGVPCWSLAALLDYLSANFRVGIKYLDNYWELDCRVQVTYSKELVDACCDMFLKVKELEML